ncbi:MAG: hypothetical protein VX211_06210 [Pseudomonadota bacterium]|nr:hypothetical protein [Pseudomonadota bacterium]
MPIELSVDGGAMKKDGLVVEAEGFLPQQHRFRWQGVNGMVIAHG